MEAAFQQATLREADVCAVLAWTASASPDQGDMMRPLCSHDEAESGQRRLLAEPVSGMRERFPDVTVQEL